MKGYLSITLRLLVFERDMYLVNIFTWLKGDHLCKFDSNLSFNSPGLLKLVFLADLIHYK